MFYLNSMRMPLTLEVHLHISQVCNYNGPQPSTLNPQPSTLNPKP